MHTNLCGNKHACHLNSYIRRLRVCILRTCHMTGGDEPDFILLSPFRSSVKFCMVGVRKSGLKVSCLVVVSVENGHFLNIVIFGVV